MSSQPSTSLIKLVEDIQRDVSATDNLYAVNFVPSLISHPIPFFGQLEEAEVLTVGLNPSAGEFRRNRWPQVTMSGDNLARRLHNYFGAADLPPHPWFEKWTIALSQLNTELGYKSGKVAHIDLSPRATASSHDADDLGVFYDMLQNDSKWLPHLLGLARKARLLLIAGTVNQQSYLFEFLSKHGNSNGIAVVRKDSNKGKSVGFYEISFGSKKLPAFFSGSSPSARDQGLKLKINVFQYREKILGLFQQNAVSSGFSEINQTRSSFQELRNAAEKLTPGEKLELIGFLAADLKRHQKISTT